MNDLEKRMQKDNTLVEKETGKHIRELNWIEYITTLNKLTNEGNIFPPCVPAQTALTFLQRYLLGEDWYVTDPLCNAQVNPIIVEEILYKYSKRFRKEFRLYKRKRKENSTKKKKFIFW